MSGGRSKGELVTLVKEINRIHAEIVENAQAQVQRGIECGVMLKEVRDNIKFGDWEDWLAKHCPEISERTARVYLRLAKNSDKLETLAAENGSTAADLSMRGALRLLATQKTEEEKAKAKAEREAKAKAKEAEAKLAAVVGANLTDVIKAKGTDEIKTALKQADRFDEVARAITPPLQMQLKDTTPPRLADAVADVWPPEDVHVLIKLLIERVKKSAASETTFRSVQAEART
jgi:hypothetical protein